MKKTEFPDRQSVQISNITKFTIDDSGIAMLRANASS